jgi:2-polyprenyl-3-methyl-5-hydroxy-6-metoxy-1,4-benzoquinol methylase
MNARKQEVDKTFLSLDLARERGFLHRDYLAHCLRWSHVVKKLMEKKTYAHAKILDIGCGRELPLARTLYSSRIIPLEYRGIDAGPINEDVVDGITKTGKFPLHISPKTDVLKLQVNANDKFTHAVMFEVAEHVEPKHLAQILLHVREHLLVPSGTLWLSTPSWNQTDTANNHVNEMAFEFLGKLFATTGWWVENVWGTFASIRDYEKRMNPAIHDIFNELREYYDTNVLSIIFAPLFPDRSRNCLWELWNTEADMHKFNCLIDGNDNFHHCGSTTTAKWDEFYQFMQTTGLLV